LRTIRLACTLTISTFSKTILKGDILDHEVSTSDLKNTGRPSSRDRHRIPTVNHDVLVDDKRPQSRIQRDCLTIDPIRKGKPFNVVLAYQAEGLPKS
jgi:hypothetical protein